MRITDSLIITVAVVTVDAGCPFGGARYRHSNGAIKNLDIHKTHHNHALLERVGATETPFIDSLFVERDAHGVPNDYHGRPHPRVISNEIFSQSDSVPDKRGLSAMVMQMGQLIDHDLAETHFVRFDDSADIEVSEYDEYLEGNIQFPRAQGLEGYAQLNEITHVLDASFIYGSGESQNLGLREVIQDTGIASYLLRTSKEIDGVDLSERGLLPPLGSNQDGQRQFLVGDARGSEQPCLTTIHTIWLREHNRVAKIIKEEVYPYLSDSDMTLHEVEYVYDEARLIVESEWQKIVLEDWLPTLTGRKLKFSTETERCAAPTYDSLHVKECERVDPRIHNWFANSLFRFGHSMVNDEFWRMQDGEPHEVGHIKLGSFESTGFFKPVEIFKETDFRIEPLIEGLLNQPNQAIDTKLVDSLRNHLFRNTSLVGNDIYGSFSMASDLLSLNIQRGRDTGIPDYQSIRYALTGKKVQNFKEMIRDPQERKIFATTYKNDISNVDLYAGMLAENKIPGASVGPTLRAGLEAQFSLLQRGDCLFYKTRLTCDGECQPRRNYRRSATATRDYKHVPLAGLRESILDGSRTLAGIISDNTKLDLPENYDVFRTKAAQYTERPYLRTPKGNPAYLYGFYKKNPYGRD